ncbi:MAG TPA: hypothetical protein VF179_33120 [Thermoanaerobaculia bacterium]|nr:hypothetical protein [Thermoanaerobaculia bacterium]
MNGNDEVLGVHVHGIDVLRTDLPVLEVPPSLVGVAGTEEVLKELIELLVKGHRGATIAAMVGCSSGGWRAVGERDALASGMLIGLALSD